MEEIVNKVQDQLRLNLPFVLYSKPNSKEVIVFFQKNDSVFEANDFTEKGFIMASFDGAKNYLIPESESEVVYTSLDKKEIAFSGKELTKAGNVAKSDFESLVNKGIQAIKNEQFQKVVLSRTETVAVANFDMVETFQKLVFLYPTAFVYCFYHPKIGNWIGATPEQLLKVTENNFETISLAGTQKDTGSSEILWGEKEKEEQEKRKKGNR